MKISDISEEYLTWLQVERRFAQSSIISYRSRIKCFIRDVGDIEIEKLERACYLQIYKKRSIQFESSILFCT